MPPTEASNWRAWAQAVQDGGLNDRLRGWLNEIDDAVRGSGFTCQQSGRCCQFESFGHRLYMTGLEIAWFRSLAGGEPGRAESPSTSLPVIDGQQDGCPYQIEGLCSVHLDRPFACRVFFCQEGSDDWQSEQYEAFQAKIKALHDELGLPYHYMEWRVGLAAAQAHGL